jgi:hypothetical protein
VSIRFSAVFLLLVPLLAPPARAETPQPAAPASPATTAPTSEAPAAPPAPTESSPPVAKAPAAVVAQAAIRTGNHGNFGRVVIDLPPGASATATAEAGAARVHVVGASFAGGARPPRNVAAITELGGDATLTLAPGAHFTATHLPAPATGQGSRLVIDVFAEGAGPAAAPTAAPSAPSAAPPAAPATKPAPISPQAFSGPPPRSGPLPAVAMPAAPPPIAAAAVAAVPPAPLPAAASRPAAAEAKMAQAPAQAVSGPTQPQAPAPAANPATLSQAAPNRAATRSSERVRVPLQALLEGKLPAVLRPPGAAMPAIVAAPAALPAPTASTAVAAPAVPASPPSPPAPASPVSPPAPPSPASPSAPMPAPVAMAAPARTHATVAAPVTEVEDAPLPPAPAPTVAPTDRPAEPQPAPAAAASAPAAAAPANPVAAPGASQEPVAIAARADGATLILPFAANTGAAAFRRDGELVVVFDERRPLDLSNLSGDPAVAAAFRDARIQVLPAATLLRMSLPDGAGVRLSRVEEGWALTRLPAPPLLAAIRGDIADGTMRLVAAGPSAVVSVPDPATGGALLVGTQTKPGQGVPVTRRTPEFTLLETLQGVAVDPASDALALRVAPAKDFVGFVLAAEGDAAEPVKPPPPKPAAKPAEGAEGTTPEKPGAKPEGAAEPKAADKAPAPVAEESGRGVALDPPGPEAVAALEAARMTRRWDLPALPTEALLRRLQAATAGAAAAPPQARAAGRLAAVQAQIALGLGAEAQALATLIVADDARATDTPDVVGLTAIAAILDGRLDESAGIDDPRLDGTDEVALWRAVRQAMLREGAPDAAARFAATMPLLLAYPEALRERLLPLAAETMVLGGEQEAARRLLAARKDDGGLDYARALLDIHDGKVAPALVILDRLALSVDRLQRARSAVAAAELRLRSGAFTTAQAADALDKLIYSWRGDRRELDLRLRVAELREKSGNWRAALALLRETADAPLGETWPDALPDIHDRMAQVFARALEGDARKALPPLEMVSLIEENPDLLPAGEQGRALAARLADRLVALDLPERAIPVLEKLMKATPEGPARAEIGARLASVRLDDHDPTGALEALSDSAADGLPAAVNEARTITFARATAARGALAPATAALAALGTPEADEVRATLSEQAKDWHGAVTALLSYVQKTVPADGPLAEAPANTLLRLASAAAQAGDEALLGQLRDHDLARMPAGKLADMFKLLTERPVQGVADLPRAAKEAAFAGTLPAELDAPAQ